MSAREELYAFATAAFKETGAPPLVHKYLTKSIDAYRAEVLREAADALEARVADEDVDTRTTWAGMDAAYLRHMAAASEKSVTSGLTDLFERLGPPTGEVGTATK